LEEGIQQYKRRNHLEGTEKRISTPTYHLGTREEREKIRELTNNKEVPKEKLNKILWESKLEIRKGKQCLKDERKFKMVHRNEIPKQHYYFRESIS